jgi:hypothetical protein
MKVILAAFCCLFASAAFGQAVAGGSVLSNQPYVMQMPSHPERASQQGLATPQDLLERTSFVIIQGEKSLDVNPSAVRTSEPLGDIARLLRKQRAFSKKAETLWEN